ncbi:hypothetical protein [Sphingopyxis sp. DBS4]|uniref:hypothetical protein n=1 Tax=Sphingopyxis sp. DBS4 TaxID=2968500 RepID=UPI00214BA875|nr:hypothetical protein [Sphingopyxis sp. DBS4]
MVNRLISISIIIIFLSSCGSSKLSRDYVSPDGEIRAVVSYTDKGACCSNSYKVVLFIDGGKEEVFSGSGSGKIFVYWQGNDLLNIKTDDIYKYEITARIFRKNPVLPDGSENSVRVRYIN